MPKMNRIYTGLYSSRCGYERCSVYPLGFTLNKSDGVDKPGEMMLAMFKYTYVLLTKLPGIWEKISWEVKMSVDGCWNEGGSQYLQPTYPGLDHLLYRIK